ncbi:MAG: hypothetical protein QXJ14_02515 [Candidatus Aenigmatarchaeota archaeon]
MSLEERIAKLEERVENLEKMIQKELDHINFYQKLIIILIMALLSLAGLKELVLKLFVP